MTLEALQSMRQSRLPKQHMGFMCEYLHQQRAELAFITLQNAGSKDCDMPYAARGVHCSCVHISDCAFQLNLAIARASQSHIVTQLLQATDCNLTCLCYLFFVGHRLQCHTQLCSCALSVLLNKCQVQTGGAICNCAALHALLARGWLHKCRCMLGQNQCWLKLHHRPC